MSIAERLALAPELRDTQAWSAPEESSLGETDRAVYVSRKRAVCAYLEGTPLSRIQESYGYTKVQVYRMVGRCLESRPDGSMFGFYALIPRMTVASYRRRASFNSESSIGRRDTQGYSGS
ncbi:hypothetical protein LMG31886_21580 [Xanthomonas hydrangeae]|nr:hypothetical protein LMG31886_21580 [Xanthomonas hydrangeae]CAD7734887.1 hypothetical protein LMG31886_21580 [Xanthomonas hydrangeae]CAD7744909.1 hypothetical protein LMG31885_38650 [Xanthomonas hydrangeae]CAD7744911.1 hypothetical protein LMG31885_38650 [Xanthomonas hydrangeae]